jgi:hypothetical protein
MFVDAKLTLSGTDSCGALSGKKPPLPCFAATASLISYTERHDVPIVVQDKRYANQDQSYF